MKKILVLSYFLISFFVLFAQKNDLVLAINKLAPASVDSVIGNLKGYALIITECKDYSEVAATREFIIEQGGSVSVIGSKNTMLGWINPSIAGKLIGHYGITAIQYKPIELSTIRTSDRQTLSMVKFFNSATSSTLVKPLYPKKSIQGKKMEYFDALPHPEIAYDDYIRNLKKNKLNIENLNTKNKILRVKSDGALITGNSDRMVGTVTVAVFMVESNGAIDPNLYTWTTADEDSMYQNTLRNLSWWSDMAMKYGKALTFNVIPHYHTDTVCQQPYEPILHSTGEDNLWIGSIMNKLGFTEGVHTTRVEAYNTWLRETYNTDWAYSVFFAYNPSTAPNSFTDGYGGYACLGGPYTQILFQWFGYGSVTVSHETGHIFGALDEYYLPGYGGCGGGAFNNTGTGIPNGNCMASNVNSVDCMMKENSNALCAYTPAHIGWIDKVSEISLVTNPQGLNVTVEVGNKISPQSFPWGRGTQVNISVVTPQTLNGKTYEFRTWSDDGAQSHSITVSDTTKSYTANFSETGVAPQNWLLYQSSNGLPSLDIRAVTFNKQGEVWVGTGGGLSKFDGKKWITYNTMNSGIPTNYVTSMVIDSQGNKWIGTAPYFNGSVSTGGGLVKFNGTTWTVYNTTNSGLPSNNVKSIAIDGAGNKWIATDAGLVKFDDTSWTGFNNLPSKNINAITIDKSGNKWICTEAGLAKIVGTFTTVYTKLNSGLPDNTVMSIAIDSLGNKWIGTFSGGLSLFNDQTWINYSTSNSGIPDNDVRAIAIDGSGNKWIGTSSGGMAKLDGSTWTVYNNSTPGLPGNYITTISIDSSGNKWIGTISSGLARFDNINWSVFTYTNLELLDNRVSSIAIDSTGNKWIGTGGGLGRFDGTEWMDFTTSNSGLPFFYVSSIVIDGSGNKWIGTWGGGLAKFDGTNWTVYNTSNSGLPDNMVMTLTLDSSGNKWIGTLSGGLVKFDGTNWTVYNTSNSGLPDNDVRSIAIDHSGNKWVGTWGGLAKFDGSNWTIYTTSNSGLPDNYVNSIAIDGLGNKWIGTSNTGGLAKFDSTNWTVYNTSNSDLPSNSINSIAIDNSGNKWIGCNGLVKFDDTNWTVYTSSNSGLPINNVMSLTIDGFGNKWIGTDDGLAVFNEEGITSVKDILNKDSTGEPVLFQNYPNPFSSYTNILFNLSKNSFVSLKVFDLEGRVVATIVSGEMTAGIHLQKWYSGLISNGIYLYQLKTDLFSETKKLILQR